jgi:signal transduction histidine kinase
MGLAARWTALRARTAVRAAAAERERLAREIHDGLAQELAFISLQARRLADQDVDGADQLIGAAVRALAESRQLITTLRSSTAEDLSGEIARTAHMLADRHGATLELDVDPAFRPDAKIGRHLQRILAEALSNGLVHGRARNVAIELSASRLRVADDGVGFETEVDRPRERFGVVGMRERAQEIGGDFLLRSHPGHGTEVIVVLPSADPEPVEPRAQFGKRGQESSVTLVTSGSDA